MKTILFGLTFIFFFGCSDSENNPENQAQQTLQTYIQEFFKVKSLEDLGAIKKITGGSLRAQLDAIDEVMFSEIFGKSNYQLINFKIQDRKLVAPERFSFIYEIKVVSNRGGRHTQNNRKIAFVTKENMSGEWLLTEVKNINSTINYSEELSIIP
jgi:hypothetical protein